MGKKKEKVEEENVRKIESLKEFAALTAARANCSKQSCSNCPMSVNKKGEKWKDGCQGTIDALYKFAQELTGVENIKVIKGGLGYDDVDDPAIVAYDTVMAMDLPVLGVPDQKQEPEKEGRCFTCLMSQMHTSGILWCKSFGNFVHEDGFCYRYKSDKIET